MKILFTGGGTGGHLLPLIAISRELQRRYGEEPLKFFYVGPKDMFTDVLLSHEHIQVHSIPAGKIRRYWTVKTVFANFFDVFVKFPLSIFLSFFKLLIIRPDFILSKGGFGALPVTIMGWFLRTPVFLHESDISPGLANRIGGRFALEIFTSFQHTEFFSKEKLIFVGNPIRTELLNGSMEEARQIFTLQGDKPIILILGGSQGAKRINNIVLNVLDELTESFELIHVVGENNYRELRKEADIMVRKEDRPYYHPFPFLLEAQLRHAYAAADFIVSRAGSGAIFEIAALGKPSILLPLPESAQDHQLKNAYAYAQSGGAIVLEEANLTSHFFVEKIRSIVFSPEQYEKMSQAAYAFSKVGAAKVMASYIVEFLRQK